MKKLILFILLFTFSFSTAQKKELRNANKFFVSGEYASAIDLLDSAKDLFDSSDDKIIQDRMDKWITFYKAVTEQYNEIEIIWHTKED